MPSHGPWHHAIAVAICLLCGAMDDGPVSGQAVSEEYRLKAAFVSRFPQFVEWPAHAMNEERAFELCVLAPDPFGPALAELVQGEQLRARPIILRRVRPSDGLEQCHVLYVPASTIRRAALLRRLTTQPILTISDAPRFLEDGGIVQLRMVSNRVRFDVSTAAAGRAGLRISSQLLQLAASVQGGAP